MYDFPVSTDIKAKALVRNSIFLLKIQKEKRKRERERNELFYETIKPAEQTNKKPNSMA